MQTQRIVLSLLAAMLLPAVSSAGPLQTIFTFNGHNGANPGAGLLLGAGNTLYGTTTNGGSHTFGTVFQLPLPTWRAPQLTRLHNFTGHDGAFPGSGVVADATGALYGTTSNAYTSDGTIYRLDPATKALTVLWAFSGGADGGFPNAGLTLDGNGAAYGTTTGGALGYGTVYKIDLATHALTTLHAFTNTDGAYPYPGVVLDGAGALWGAAPFGGANGLGVLYKLDPATQAYAVEYSFGVASGSAPEATLTIGPDGSFYGTTAFGGNPAHCVGSSFSGCGTLFNFNPATGAFKVLHTFTGGNDGGASEARLAFGPDGQLYGTTYLGGLVQYCAASTAIPPGCGTVFRIDPATDKLTTLHAFTGAADGGNPFNPLTFTPTGIAFGLTNIGGNLAACPSTTGPAGCGTLYELSP